MSGRVQRDLADHVREEVLEGFSAQCLHILGNSAQKLLDFGFGDVVEYRSGGIFGLQALDFG
ncbi:MAG: hypothetical protein AB2809_24675 [Candidatus Thiodiazotropha sp.]